MPRAPVTAVGIACGAKCGGIRAADEGAGAGAPRLDTAWDGAGMCTSGTIGRLLEPASGKNTKGVDIIKSNRLCQSTFALFESRGHRSSSQGLHHCLKNSILRTCKRKEVANRFHPERHELILSNGLCRFNQNKTCLTSLFCSNSQPEHRILVHGSSGI